MPDDPRPPDRDAHDVRCSCGNLLARRTARGIEIKCRRCKRVVLVVPLTGGQRGHGSRGPADAT
jgi:hypothetical protein